MINKGTLTIKGKEYNFLKPKAFRLIAIEDAAYETGEFDVNVYNQAILNIVDRKLKAEDFIVKNFEPVDLGDGNVVSVRETVTYDDFIKKVQEIGKPSRLKYAEAYLRFAGFEGENILDNFGYEELNTLAEAFVELFDISELNETIEMIVEYCFPR